jgi:hypothetical protein
MKDAQLVECCRSVTSGSWDERSLHDAGMAGYLSIAVFLVEVMGNLDSNPRYISTCIAEAKNNGRPNMRKRPIELAEQKWKLADLFFAETHEPERHPLKDGEDET